MYYYKTPLKRNVQTVREYREDLILKVLYDSQEALFSDDTPLSLRLLAESAGISPREAKKICQYLRGKKFIEQAPVPRDEDFYRLTPEGVRFVELRIT